MIRVVVRRRALLSSSIVCVRRLCPSLVSVVGVRRLCLSRAQLTSIAVGRLGNVIGDGNRRLRRHSTNS